MTEIRCNQCLKPFILELHEDPYYKGVILCPTCLEVRKLLDGLFIDLNIGQIERLILEDVDSGSLSRGVTAIN